MATLNPKILKAALDDGVFKKPLNSDNRVYLKASVITAIEIVTLIKKHQASGLECGDIAKKMGLNYTTVNRFLLWLKGVKLVEAIEQQRKTGKPVLYYPRSKAS